LEIVSYSDCGPIDSGSWTGQWSPNIKLGVGSLECPIFYEFHGNGDAINVKIW